jgi:hypothetical protein
MKTTKPSEIIRAFNEKRIINYKDKKYNNFEFLKNKLRLWKF